MSSMCSPTRPGRRMGNAQSTFQLAEDRADMEEPVDSLPWGDTLPENNPDCVRIGFWNCGGFPSTNNDVKNQFIREIISSKSFDIFGFSECNVYWPAIDPSQRLRERTIGWFESLHISSAYLHPWKPRHSFQVGGVSLWSLNSSSHRVSQSGSDLCNLGRWAWTCYRGKNGLVIRVIVAYRCALNKTGPISAWNQQKLVLEGKHIDTDPREQFITDLLPLLDSWIEAGEQIILGLDLNESVITSSFSSHLARRGIVECITSRHGQNPPPTYSRGSQPIDGIFTSLTLQNLLCGYLPITGDHRILWIDLPVQLLFGASLPASSNIRARRLKLIDPRVVSNYQESLLQFYESHNIEEAVASLADRHPGPLSPREIMEYERIDALRVQGMRRAEKHCRKLRMGAVPFSPQYSKLSQYHLCWKLIVRLKDGKKIDSRYLSRMLRQNNIDKTFVNSLSQPESVTYRNSAYAALRAFKISALPSRVTWLEELSQARSEAGLLSAEQEYKSLLLREKQRKDARIIRGITKSTLSMGLSLLHKLDPDGKTVCINDKAEMEQSLINELTTRFNQARGTPFTTEPLYPVIGNLGISQSSLSVLDGSFHPPANIDIWTRKLLTHLREVPSAQQIRTNFTLDLSTSEYSKGWEKMKEQTSPGFSQLSFAQFKAAALEPTLASIDCTLANIPYSSGYHPTRWRKGIDVMLQKQPGNFLPNKLRAILLFEPDFNQNNKRLGRDSMYWAESVNAVAMEQFGSRKFHAAIDQSLNKVLTFDLWRQFKCSGALCSNDAKSCYDRIVHSVASLCLQRLGVPSAPIVSMFSTIQSLEHHVRTLHGVSEQSFSGYDWQVPIQGVGQGNGAGPQIWAAVSTPVLNMLRSEHLGTTLSSAISGDKLFFVGYAFVDDTDLAVSRQRHDDTEFTVTAMQQSLNAWEGGIRATGGAIVPEKSHWHLIQFKWVDGNATYCSVADAPASISVRDSTGSIRQLRRLEPWEADRTLGVRIAPDGNMQVQFLHMRESALSWAEKIRKSNLPRHLVHLAFNSTFLRSLRYPLTATTLSESQCTAIISPISQAVLPKMGIVRTVSKIVRQAPPQYLGLGFPNLYWLQGIDHIDRLIRYGCSDHLTGKLIRHSLEVMQIEVGCPQCVLSLDHTNFGSLVTPTWLSTTWKFLSEYNISIITNTPSFSLHRSFDQFLIPILFERGFRGKQLARLNKCRIYLQVMRLSDISTGCGKFITTWAWEGERDTLRPSSLLWPNQSRLPKHYWEEWRAALASVCINGRQLTTPLGEWTSTESVFHYYSPSVNRIYARNITGWSFHPSIPERRNRSSRSKFGTKTPTTDIPTDLLPATVTRAGPYLHLTGCYGCSSLSKPGPQSLQEYIRDHLTPIYSWLNGSFSTSGTLQHQIQSLQLSAVSDGSYKDQHGTAAWIILVNDSTSWSGEVVTPGSPSSQSAYRSELAGIYSILCVTFAIQKFYKVKDIQLTIGCDGLSAIQVSAQSELFINPNIQHYDLILSIRRIAQLIQGNINWRHIKGHQDDTMDAVLDEWALLNIAMDTKAKEAWEKTKNIAPTERLHNLWCDAWQVVIDGVKVTSNLQASLLDWLGKTLAIPYWTKRYNLTTSSQNFDWSIYSDISKAMRPARRTWVTKWLADVLPTGKNMVRWKMREISTCPRCSDPMEDSNHLILCTSNTAATLWDSRMMDLQQHLILMQTVPEASTIICERLHAWRNGSLGTTTPSNQFTVDAAVGAQDTLGWDKFFMGFLCLEWLSVQDQYYKFINSHRTGKRWAISIIRKLWEIAWDFWDQRNEFLHNAEQGLLVSQLNEKIQQQFLLGSRQLTKSARGLLAQGKDKVLGFPLHLKIAWIDRVEVARRRYEETSDNSFDSERRIMARWLLRK